MCVMTISKDVGYFSASLDRDIISHFLSQQCASNVDFTNAPLHVYAFGLR